MKSTSVALNLADIQNITRIVGSTGIDVREEATSALSKNTVDAVRNVVAIVSPSTQDQVIEVVKYFYQHGITYYPISTGLNWGYGSAVPVSDNNVILDLSRLKTIRQFNQDLGYITVEPGVTQKDLYEFLQARCGDLYLVPTTGAGPNASILGNALERGYGITPIEDHFAAVLSIKAILPDGSLYQSALREAGGVFSDEVFKWKIGPFLDGLFAQSNLGVVLEMSVALKQKPQNVSQFVIFVKDETIEDAVLSIRKIRNTLGGVTGGVNLMNKRRLLSMLESEWTHNRALEEIRVIELSGKRELSDWVVVGALYGTDDVVKAGLKFIKKECSYFANRMIFLDKNRVNLAKKVLNYLPLKKFQQMLETASNALEILAGKPSEMALPLAYLKNRAKPSQANLNPDRDNCGLFWFAPLVPMDPPTARDFVQEVTKVCLSFDIDPLITLTSVTERCFDATIPILYNKELLGEKERALSCLTKLLEVSKEMGLFPYRLSVNHMDRMPGADTVSTKMYTQIKQALDPNNLLAPGRYHNLKA